jgi:signal transduction histidine kinase
VALRGLANLTRRLAGEWCGVAIADPYRPPPGDVGQRLHYTVRLRWLLGDVATWRDLLWVMVNALVGWILALASMALTVTGLVLFLVPTVSKAVPPPGFPGNTKPTLAILGFAMLTAGVALAPWLLRGYGLLASSMLSPPGAAELALRVRHLAQTRTEVLDTGAAEIRRIERDLHDGAQARLVAMGMTLDAAGQIIDSNPDAARALLWEARDASVKALAELRALVRGIHPPVLADRGLAEAIRALTLDTPMRIHLASDLVGRPSAPIESAGYFAVSELLANVSKHAEARETWIDIRHTDGMLRIGVTDNGHGGADPARGSGLRGIERRLAAFDGVVAISSPPGGPTAVTMEIPCELSSPKTSSC